MPVVTRESSAGTGEKDALYTFNDRVITIVSLQNPNVTDRAETSRIELYDGTSKTGILAAVLAAGWTNSTHALTWTGRLNLTGDWVLVGTINHASSVKHRLSIVSEQREAMPEGLARLRGFWRWPRA